MIVPSLQHRRLSNQFLPAAGLALLILLTGSWVAKAPVKAWLVLLAAAGLVLFRVAAVYWIVAAVLMATLSRLLGAISGPHFLDFMHYPLVIGALVVALAKGATPSVAKPLGIGLGAFLLTNVLSWILNDGEFIRPLLDWLVYAEPFIVVYVLLAAPPTERMSRTLWKLILGLALLQVPLGVWEWVRASGEADFVQGSFIGSGTGAHVAGAVALLGAMIAICRASVAVDSRNKARLFTLAVPLFTLSVIADAKQVIFCFLPGVLWAILCAARVSPFKLLLPALFTSFVFYAAFNLYTPLKMIEDQGLISAGYDEKLAGLSAIASKLSSPPVKWLFGLGPGNTVSRVALLTPDVDLSAKSSVALLGLKTSPVTRELVAAMRSSDLYTSSAFSGVASWFGLLGDLGVIGVLVYLWIVRLLWGGLSQQRDWQSASSKGAIIMTGLLGGVYVWLEEPGFTLLVAMMTGLTLASHFACNEPRYSRVAEQHNISVSHF